MPETGQTRLLYIGDVSARPGRSVVHEILPKLKVKYHFDWVIANIENAAAGRGVTRQILEEFNAIGIDYFTAGEHIWDRVQFTKEMQDSSLPILRAYNYEAQQQLPGKGWVLLTNGSKKLLLALFLGQTFMRENVRNPFWAADELWDSLIGEGIVGATKIPDFPVVFEIHAEATSEKKTFGYYARERASCVVGTHTHVPTADTQINFGQAYVTDIGMCGIHDASLWVEYEKALLNFKYPYKNKFEPKLEGKRVFNSVMVEFQDGIATKIKRLDFAI